MPSTCHASHAPNLKLGLWQLCAAVYRVPLPRKLPPILCPQDILTAATTCPLVHTCQVLWIASPNQLPVHLRQGQTKGPWPPSSHPDFNLPRPLQDPTLTGLPVHPSTRSSQSPTSFASPPPSLFRGKHISSHALITQPHPQEL